jgi:hypothetical protein
MSLPHTPSPAPRRATLTLAAALGFAVTGCASARHAAPLAGPDRPGYSYGTATVAPGGVQLEVGYTDAWAGGATYHAMGEGLLRVGVGSSTELRAFANSFAVRTTAGPSEHGFEDTKLGVKQRLFAGRGASGPSSASVALLAGTSLPTGSSGFGAGVWQPEATLAAVVPLTSRFGVTTNAGYVYAANGAARAHRVLATLAGSYAVTSKIGAFAEYAGSQLTTGASTRTEYVDAGFTFVPVASVQLDVRVGQGLNGAADDRFFGLGVTRRW